jgi:hypothetical protein
MSIAFLNRPRVHTRHCGCPQDGPHQKNRCPYCGKCGHFKTCKKVREKENGIAASGHTNNE